MRIGLSSRVWNFFRLTRAVFLLGGFLLYLLGTVIAVWLGVTIDPWRFVLGQMIVTSIQLMAHYSNEYFDLEGDRINSNNRTWFSGGSGVLSNHGISPAAVILAARVCGGIALVLILIVSLYFSPLVAIIAFVSLLGSWFYSSPPVALMSTGWGEITTSIIVAVLVPLTGVTIQNQIPSFTVLLICSPLFLLHWSMLVAFEFPDRETDRAIGKKTITVRLGSSKTAVLHSASIIVAFLVTFRLVQLGWNQLILIFMLLPLAVIQIIQSFSFNKTWSKKRLNIFTFGAVSLFALSVALYLLGFILELS